MEYNYTNKDENYYGILSTTALRRIFPSLKINIIFLGQAAFKGIQVLQAAKDAQPDKIGEEHETALKAWADEVKAKKPKLEKAMAKVGEAFKEWAIESEMVGKLEEVGAAYAEAQKANLTKKRRLEADQRQERQAIVEAGLDELIEMIRDGADEDDVQKKKRRIIFQITM